MRLLALVAALPLALVVAQTGCDPNTSDDDDAVEADALADGELVVELSMDKSQFGAGDAVTATVTMTNLSSRAVRFLSWRLPEADLEEPLFTVTREGRPARFLGRHFKRGSPDASNYVTLRAGDSLVRSVDLARFYEFEASGNYQIGIDIPMRNDRSRLLSAKATGAWVDQHQLPLGDSVNVTASVGALSFSRCDATQQSTIIEATASANQMSDEAVAFLANAPAAAQRYKTWFGAYTAARQALVKQHFSAIADALDTQPMTFDCGCAKENYYAYVYPNKPYTVYLCNAFWSAPMLGWDSLGGTIVHEFSHFNAVASTNDWDHGLTACMTLAETKPDWAIDNADNYEYFAEQGAQP